MSTGLRVFISNFPALNTSPADVEFRIGREEPQTGTWETTTGQGGSNVQVPDSLHASVLQAGRIAVRVQGHTRVVEWRNGGDVYEIMRACAGE